jgi:hypothetical protein
MFIPQFSCFCPFSVSVVATSVGISRTVFCTHTVSLTDWFLFLSNLVIRNRRLECFICDTSSLCSSLFFSTSGQRNISRPIYL